MGCSKQKYHFPGAALKSLLLFELKENKIGATKLCINFLRLSYLMSRYYALAETIRMRMPNYGA